MIATWEHYPEPPFLYCPVRSRFNYESPLGVALNLLASGNAMYPPVFRDDRGPVLNRNVVEACVRLLASTSRAVVAMHPEGTRNRSDDPYALRAPKAGVGRIALASRAPVVPAFVNGVPRSFGRLLREHVPRGAEPVRVLLGPPVELHDLYHLVEDRGTHREAAERTMAAIAALGGKDRALMAEWRNASGRWP